MQESVQVLPGNGGERLLMNIMFQCLMKSKSPLEERHYTQQVVLINIKIHHNDVKNDIQFR